MPGKQKFPGQLVIDQKKETIHLEIYGPMYIEGVTINRNVYPEHFHTMILGDYPTCTLYDCHWAGTKELGKDLYRITYRVEYVFTGFHFADPEIPIRGGTFEFAHLGTWYDGSEFLDKLEGKQGLFVAGEAITQNVLREDEIQINPELTLVLWDEVTKRIVELSISYRVEYDKFIRFQYGTSVPFNRLLKDAITFLKLLSFCFGKPLNLFMIYAYADKAKISGPEDSDPFGQSDKQLLHVNNYTLMEGREVRKHNYHSRHLAVSGLTLSKDELHQVIIRWFANENLYGVYEYYLDSNNWFSDTKAVLSHVMFNNRFLNLIQGLEAYYNEFYPRKKTIPQAEQQLFKDNKKAVIDLIQDETLKVWLEQSLTPRKARELSLKEKLDRLISDLTPDLKDVFKKVSLSEFSQSAGKFRNQLSHGGNQEIDLGVRLHEEYYIAQVLLGVCILRSLGVTMLNERAAYYSKFEEAAYQIFHFQKQRCISQ